LGLTLDHATLRSVTPTERRGRLLEPGDLLLEKSGGGDAQPVGVVALFEDRTPAVCSNFLARMPPARGFDASFLRYLHAAIYSHGVNTRSIKQTTGIQNLDTGAYLSEIVCVPDPAEQRRIALWLDQRITALATLAEKHQRLDELLQEQRLALISRAMTRGLEPAAPLKRSGIPWLGEVPAHWQVTRLKFIRRGALLYGASQEGEIQHPGWPRYIRITDLTTGGTLRPDTVRSLPPEAAAPYLLEDGDILLARSGATVGKAFRYQMAWGPACFAGYLIRLRSDRRRVMPEYLAYYTQSLGFKQEVAMQTVQATVPNVSAERYANFPIGLPPLEEQRAIVAYLDRRTAMLEAAAGKVRRQIERLAEYRAAVIAAAVTGRISTALTASGGS
jgi:type I restriction enzyme S subunit